VTATGAQANTSVAASLRISAPNTAAPIGQVDTPLQNATGVQGAIGVTGWALDDVGVTSVKIYRNCLPAVDAASACQSINGASVVFIGDAAFVPGARADIESAFPSYPQNSRAGWGYLMLTNMLPNVSSNQPNGGQGPLTIYAFATDAEGNRSLLGRAWAGAGSTTPTSITMANASIAKPFGAIDTPSQGQTVSGVVPNFGWALTPDSNTVVGDGDIHIPSDGSTMRVVIDGVFVGTVTYNQCRGNVGNPISGGVFCNDDVSNVFGNATPQPSLTSRASNPTVHRNLDSGRSPIGSFDINTLTMTNGRHSIAWGVTDSAGRSEGIGSREFIVLNGSSLTADLDALADAAAMNVGASADVDSLPLSASDVTGRTSFDFERPLEAVMPDRDGVRHVSIPELGRLELWLGDGVVAGYLRANDDLRPLPPGSVLDASTGRFTWSPIVGYIGPYDLVFVTAHDARIPIRVTVHAKASEVAGSMRAHIDLPVTHSTVSGSLTVAGWALDPDAWQGSGVDAVHVWAVRRDVPAADPEFLGAAQVGVARPDVARAFGAQFDRAGWHLDAIELQPGTYDVLAYFWSSRTQRFEDARTVRITVH
jgi:hypothetical protein